jgi:hypothetical protein
VRRNLLLIAALLALQGCICDRTDYVADKWPIIKSPSVPALDPKDENPSLVALRVYALQLEAGIKEYNTQAREHNVANGYPETGTK